MHRTLCQDRILHSKGVGRIEGAGVPGHGHSAAQTRRPRKTILEGVVRSDNAHRLRTRLVAAYARSVLGIA
eukprot:3809602-Rhodomonas_salina.1